MSSFLFDEFIGTPPAAWKQKIQVDLRGDDFNDNLLWKTKEGIVVKPFYTKEDRTNIEITAPENSFNICQKIVITNDIEANRNALDAIKKGANSIQFIANKKFNPEVVLKGLDKNYSTLYFLFNFLDERFVEEIEKLTSKNNTFFQIDIIGNLAATGNWFTSLKIDHNKLDKIIKICKNPISISADLYDNAGATIVQQLAYTLAQANEYINYYGIEIANKIHFKFSVGSNYFHEIAKLKAFRLLWESLLENYQVSSHKISTNIFTEPTQRNKTIYDYNVNMLRTTTECMSAILGGSNTVANNSYDAIYADSNNFGERISRNQLLILKEESGFKSAQKITEGSYYLETIIAQFAEKALDIFKQIEKGGGLLKQLKEGNIQRKIKESAAKEAYNFNTKKLVLVGTNLQQNKNEKVTNEFEKNPFVTKRNLKTIIIPIIKKRIAEDLEKERLKFNE
ncbi:methylmalonyl-CoA mutase subunit beta [Polaribacter tangerinus]|uniref:methylmalonyl-CoA mutase subunit beta n=1 Tax=Polaribacter tangerinus TaxID=1920034 RepID=UPI000B4BDFC8|nr:methylmalonyl-CoA mutase subunit beta [Polaribacter tangerinus]